MQIKRIRALTGPNVFHNRPVMIMTLDLQERANTASDEVEHFNSKLLSLLPSLEEHHCSPGVRGGFIQRLERGTYMAHIIEHVALELSTLAGMPVSYGKTKYAGPEGVYNIAVRYMCEKSMTYLLAEAVRLVKAALANQNFDVQAVVERARKIQSRNALGPSTQAIVAAAEKRGIPWQRLNEDNLIQLGYGKGRKLIEATTTSETGSIATDLAKDKQLTKELLAKAYIPVPQGQLVYTKEEAIAAFLRLKGKVVLKPYDGHHGKGVCLNISSVKEVEEAYEIACQHTRGECAVLVERVVRGQDYRILLVKGRMIAAARRTPAYVKGDGTSSVEKLIELENQNPLRGDGHEKALTRITLDEANLCFLQKKGVSLTSIPSKGEIVFLRETANLSTGGSADDVTDLVSESIKLMCERAARLVGLDVCGIDLVCEDISQPLEGQDAAVIEVNAGPGIRMHHFPSSGQSRDVGAAIIESLFPVPEQALIPIINITGTNGKTTVTRLVNHALVMSGKQTGMTTTEGIYINGHKIVSGDTTGPHSARLILNDPLIEVAVLETARGGLVKRGLAYNWSDVGVITNIQEDHIGQDGIENLEDILKIKSLVIERVKTSGSVVLNLDDQMLVRYLDDASSLSTNNLRWFTLQADHPLMAKALELGHTVYLSRDGLMIEKTLDRELVVCELEDINFTFSGTAQYQVANALAATGVCRQLGMSLVKIRQALISFNSNLHNHGRGNIYQAGNKFLVVDYAHNPEAFKQIAEMTRQWQNPTVGVVSLPGDRDNSVIQSACKQISQAFNRVVIKEDLDLRGRPPMAMAQLMKEELDKYHMPLDIEVEEKNACLKAIKDAEEGSVIFIFFEEETNIKEVLRVLDARPVRVLPLNLKFRAVGAEQVSLA